jgi:hypothetical protein
MIHRIRYNTFTTFITSTSGSGSGSGSGYFIITITTTITSGSGSGSGSGSFCSFGCSFGYFVVVHTLYIDYKS